MSAIKITKEVAMYILNEAASLFEAGAGMPLMPDENNPENDQVALIDNINDDDTYQWANALLMFSRFLHGIVDAALNDNNELPELEDGEI